jgi:L-seryl-tRNA(Ser) seleniumtransferase
MISRKKMLKIISTAPFVGGILAGEFINGYTTEEVDQTDLGEREYRNYLQELGVPVIINARGHNTSMTGSLMRPEVMQAINATAHHFVVLDELHDKVGERIADLIGCESAMVTAGASSALTLGTAACITGMDEEKILLIPNLPGPQREVIVQKSHRYGYDHAVLNAGIEYVEVETRRDIENAVNDNTVMMLFFSRQNDAGQIKHEEFVELGKKHDIPTFIDCAAELPPVDNLWRFTDMGFDLVTFSGGKEIEGPQSAGLLLGRKDLIKSARAQHVPHSNTIGRGMKVNKEEMVGMMIALEQYIEMDHDALRKERRRRATYVGEYVESLPSVMWKIDMNEGYVGQVYVPLARITWDQNVIKRTPDEIVNALRVGQPPIVIGGGDDSISVNLRMGRSGEERIVARRLHEELEKGIA